jgi:hypothetical protein
MVVGLVMAVFLKWDAAMIRAARLFTRCPFVN